MPCDRVFLNITHGFEQTDLDDRLGWDGFDTAMHELGHNLEQLISTHFVPRPLLRNVPNTACTEAFAFLYQNKAKKSLDFLKTMKKSICTCIC